MRTIRWGIIGVGDVTEVKSGPGFQNAQHSSLTAVMRRSGDLARDYAQRHGVPFWTDDAQALIEHPEVDAVYVATPPYAHKTYTIAAAQAGKPVYVEKPMAMNHAECQAMITACHDAGVPLFVAYYRRALPRFLKIKDLVDAGAIGEIRTVAVELHQRPRAPYLDPENLPWRVQPDVAGGGLFLDMGVHTLDFLDYVLGPIRAAHGVAGNQGGYYPAEDVVTGSFVFESGVHGVGTWCFTGFQELDRTTLTGTRGVITFSSFDTQPITLTTADGTTAISIDNPPHVQQPLIQTVVDALNGGAPCPSTGESAARTTWVADRLLGH